MRDGKKNIFSDMNGGQQRPFLVTRWAGTSLLARKGDEPGIVLAWSLPAILAAHSGKTFMQVTALEIGCYRPLNNGRQKPYLA